jgi:hypothetical protein
LFARISLLLFGSSLSGFRLFASLAQAVAPVVTGLMARKLGGSRGTQLNGSHFTFYSVTNLSYELSALDRRRVITNWRGLGPI